MISIFQNFQGIDLLIYGGAFILALLFSFALHEWAHAYVAYKEGDPTAKALGRLSINPLVHLDLFGSIFLVLFGFGWAKPVPVNTFNFRSGRKSEFKVGIAGIGVNLLMTLIFGFLYVLSCTFIGPDSVPILQFVSALLLYLTTVPFILAIFNILPIFPLDGYNVLKAVVRNPNNAFFNFMEHYGMWVMLILFITGAFSFVVNAMVINVLNPLLGLYGLILGV